MDHEYFMKKALTLAEKGKGKVSPNPMVGAVIVQNGKIIGSGFHREYGSLHAEIEALNDVYKRNPNADLSKEAVLYSTLEPCCHRNAEKINPPCCERIIKEKIGTVVTASIDPNPAVAGKGIKTLKEAGISTVTGILESEEKKLNSVYHHSIQNRTPFIHLKMAQTLDSFLRQRTAVKWIQTLSQENCTQDASEYDSVLVASNTVQKDNPRLTIRHTEGRQPLRFVLDTELKIPEKSTLLTDEFREKTHIFYSPESASEKSIKKHSGKKYSIHPVDKNVNGLLSIEHVMNKAWKLGARSVLAEGGSILAGELLRTKNVNRISLFISPQLFFKGIPSIRFKGTDDFGLTEKPMMLNETEIEILGSNIHISGSPDNVKEK